MYPLFSLPYAYDAFVPYIDTETMGLHYKMHYKGYLDRLNQTLSLLNYQTQESLSSLVQHIDTFPLKDRGDILYNAGGVLNHELYFSNISPHNQNQPVGKLKEAIEKKYGSFARFREAFTDSANTLVGSGYTFLVVTPSKDLEIVNMVNQETPYIYNMIPIMTIDLWEHAYYLNYQNRKKDYIKNFFEIVDFDVVNQNYEKAIK